MGTSQGPFLSADDGGSHFVDDRQFRWSSTPSSERFHVMNSLICILTALSGLTGQLYSNSRNPPCSGPGCRQTQSTGVPRSTWNSNRQFDARSASQSRVPQFTAACQCRTCDPSVPCSPENCASQNCADCVNGCKDCADTPLTGSNDGWEPRASDRGRSQAFAQSRAQRLCPVTGEELGSMGPPIPVTISGRTIQVCCEACVTAVRRDPAKYFRRVADEIGSGASQEDPELLLRSPSGGQARVQRLCPVTGEELGSMGPPIPVTVSGRTIQVCCEACVAAVRRDPAKYFRRVADEIGSVSNQPGFNSSVGPRPRARASAQSNCPVTGERLGSMGPPIPVTVMGRTIEVCCDACVTAVRRNPARYLAKIDAESGRLR